MPFCLADAISIESNLAAILVQHAASLQVGMVAWRRIGWGPAIIVVDVLLDNPVSFRFLVMCTQWERNLGSPNHVLD